MLFEELVKQHRVHRVVADAVRFSFVVAHYQIRVHFFNLLGHQSELRDALRIDPFLVMEGDRFKPKEHFAGLLHWPDFLFKPSGRGGRAKLTVSINENGSSSGRGDTENLGDKAAVANVLTNMTDTDNVIGRGYVFAGM